MALPIRPSVLRLWEEWSRSPSIQGASIRLRNFIYTDERVIESYIEQLGGMPSKKRRKKSFGAALTGPKIDVNVEEVADGHSVEAKITWLLQALANTNKLTGVRPSAAPQKNPYLQPPLVHERCMARLFYLPIMEMGRALPIGSMKIWMSDPNSRDFSDIEFEWTGSYLLLTEVHLDNRSYRPVISGCSALRFVANAAADRPLFHRDGDEILGRWDSRPFTEKLLALGATASEQREIEVLYRIRYMTDEQWHVEGSNGRRVHDIVGYPLFIAE